MRLGLLLLFAACIGHAIAIQISLMMGILLPKTLDVLLKLREGKNLLDLDSQEHALKNQINKVAHQIDDLHRLEVSSTSRTLSLLQSSLPDRVALDLKLNNLKEYMRKIDVYYKRMKQYAGYHTGYKVNRRSIRVRRFERFTLENFATEVVAHHPNSVQSLNAHVHEYFMPGQLGIMNSNIVKSFLKLGSDIEKGTQCSMHESPQQMLIHLYNAAVATDVKAYTMMQFSYTLLRLYGKGNFTHEGNVMKDDYLQRMQEKAESMRASIGDVTRKLWNCDPEKFIHGQNYVQFTELVQGYIQNEVDLNKDGTCWDNCAGYQYTESYSCYKNLYCKHQRRCNGKVINCKFVDSYSEVCPAAPGTNRRYEYVEYGDGLIYGKKNGACPRSTKRADSWWRWVFWHCSYCLCLCDEQGKNSDRYIDLRPVLSHIAENKVVTGMRFTKEGRVIHMQIQEGVLGKGGVISSASWVPVVSYQITDRNVREDVDFHTLTWLDRAIDLDDLETDKMHEVLTGIRFRMLGTHLNFQIRLTAFDFDSGELQPEKSYWKSNHNTDGANVNPRRKIDMQGLDIPTRSPPSSKPNHESNMYLEFTNTDFAADVAQTTIPFFDSQAVYSDIPVPLAGAGIYYKRIANYGGFVAPKIITFNYHGILEEAIYDLNPDEIQVV